MTLAVTDIVIVIVINVNVNVITTTFITNFAPKLRGRPLTRGEGGRRVVVDVVARLKRNGESE